MSNRESLTLNESMRIMLDVCHDWLGDVEPDYVEDLVGVPLGRVEDACAVVKNIVAKATGGGA